MSKARPTLASLALLTLATAVPAAASAEEPDGARHETTSYAFEDDLVAGGVVQPGLEVLHVRRRGERQSLIRVRTQYVVELLESAERL
jgi:hypothetical protein